MRSNYFRAVSAGTVILLAMLACNAVNIPGGAGQQTSPAATQAVVFTSTPTLAELLPTDTATQELTATVTLTLEPSLTPTEEVALGVVNRVTTCRTGPGSAYDKVATYQPNTSLQIVGRDLGGGYVYVQNPDKPDEACWMLLTSLTTSADVTPLPAFTPLASPTLAPDFTVTFKNYDTCKGNVFTRFIIVNTGSVQFRSAYVKVTNLKNGEVTEQSVNAFDLTVGCVVAQNIAPLTPGKTGYLQSDLFQKNPKGQKMSAVFQLCTEQGLKGSCVTRTLTFTGK